MTGAGSFRTSISGATPSASTAHSPFTSMKPPRGATKPPPSIRGGVSHVPTRPPHVRVPTRGPTPLKRNRYGSRSPPEPARSFTTMTLGPKSAAMGWVHGLRSPARELK